MADLQSYHPMGELFEQLGLPGDPASIDNFFQEHVPLPQAIAIWEASWWNQAQADFIHEALREDANWQIVVDQLNTRLRG